MEHKIIHTENYLLIVEDSEIKVGDFYLTSDNTILQCEKILLGLIYSSGDYGRNVNGLKRIISHLPLNNSSLLSGVDLLPELGQKVGHDVQVDDVEKRKKELATSILYLNSIETIEALKKYIESQPKLPITFKQGNIVDGKTYTSVTRRHDGFTIWIGEYIF